MSVEEQSCSSQKEGEEGNRLDFLYGGGEVMDAFVPWRKTRQAARVRTFFVGKKGSLAMFLGCIILPHSPPPLPPTPQKNYLYPWKYDYCGTVLESSPESLQRFYLFLPMMILPDSQLIVVDGLCSKIYTSIETYQWEGGQWLYGIFLLFLWEALTALWWWDSPTLTKKGREGGKDLHVITLKLIEKKAEIERLFIEWYFIKKNWLQMRQKKIQKGRTWKQKLCMFVCVMSGL